MNPVSSRRNILPGVGHEDWGVGRDNKLRGVVDELMHSPQNSQLTRRRQGRLRFVEDVQAISTETVEKERKKGLPPRDCS